MGFAGRAGWIVDTLDDHVQTIQAATADLRRLRLRLLESCERRDPISCFVSRNARFSLSYRDERAERQ